MGISFIGAVQFWIPTAIVCVVIALLVRRNQKERRFLRPSSMIALCCISLLNAVTVWAVGFSRTGLDIKESCEYKHGVPFDEEWNNEHYMESQKIFPLHAKCNANVDLVPAWINPTIVALALLSIAFLCVAVYLEVHKFIRGRKNVHV
ncbi:hypothetical protein DF268_31170 [Streptomyces sp. V2]|uniref:Integral membrane protein n=1 Tax=Streptomyces niveiscabiei TaxID=164115 RepID=A0ABW9I7N4_9ACTN|nr:hypothetical protein [Streptomyces sp. V2]PWG09689.1 hypothetical protein DF268_31170 [Streptomyces sp. V2]